jgi:hypothetical protein
MYRHVRPRIIANRRVHGRHAAGAARGRATHRHRGRTVTGCGTRAVPASTPASSAPRSPAPTEDDAFTRVADIIEQRSRRRGLRSRPHPSTVDAPLQSRPLKGPPSGGRRRRGLCGRPPRPSSACHPATRGRQQRHRHGLKVSHPRTPPRPATDVNDTPADAPDNAGTGRRRVHRSSRTHVPTRLEWIRTGRRARCSAAFCAHPRVCMRRLDGGLIESRRGRVSAALTVAPAPTTQLARDGGRCRGREELPRHGQDRARHRRGEDRRRLSPGAVRAAAP